MFVLKLKNIYKSYGRVNVVKNLDLTLNKGEFLTLLGPSGCGKTTTLRMIAGLEIPDSGIIEINKKVVFESRKKLFVAPENRNIGMVFQSYAIWPHMKVFDNVAYPLRVKKVSRNEIRNKVGKILKIVGLDGYEKRYPQQLSGGQQQRVALARALVMEPNILLLDEPLSNLDAKLRKKMAIEIKELQRKTKVTVVYVTHDQMEAFSMSDKIAVMNNGIIHQIGTPEEIYNFPVDTFVAKFIGIPNFFTVDSVKFEEDFANVTFLRRKEVLKLPLPGKKGSRYKIAVRPSDIELSKEKGVVRGKIINRVFLGDKVEYLIAIESNTVLTVADYSLSFNEGDVVYLSFPKGVLVEDNENSTH